MRKLFAECRVLRRRTVSLEIGERRGVADAFALIVQSDDVYRGGERRVRLGRVHRGGSGARGVFLVGDVDKLSRDCGPLLSGVLLAHLIADAPKKNRGMIAVAADEGAQVLFFPVPEDEVKIERRLLTFPGVEDLVHNQKTHPVGEFQQLRGRRVVGRADCGSPSPAGFPVAAARPAH